MEDSSRIDPAWLEHAKAVGVSSGASVPEYIVDDLIAYLKAHGMTAIEGVGNEGRKRTFPLPKGLE